MTNLRSRKAFTVVELVIVIAVIAILAGVLIPTFSSIIEKAHESEDIQLAANLTKQLIIYDKPIETESDLRDAIGKDVYDTLAPKAKKNGNHFWYDPVKKQVILANYKEIKALAGEADSARIPSSTNVSFLGGGVATDPYIFAPASPRSLIIKADNSKEKNYYLMDQDGSDLVKVLANIDKIGSGGITMGSILTSLAAITGDDKNFADSISAKLENTAIVAYGTFVSNPENEIKHVYVSMDIEETSATDITINNEEPLKVEIPSNINKINTNSFDFKTESSIIINATEEELANSEMISEDAFINATITLSGTPGYYLDGASIMRPDDTELKGDLVISESSVVIDMSLLAGDTDKANKIDLVSNGDGYDLYVAVDYTGSFALSVDKFYGVAGADGIKPSIIAKGEKWVTEGNISYDEATGKFAVTGYANDDEAFAGKITAKIQNAEKVINVYGVKATNVIVEGYKNLGLNIRYENVQAGVSDTYTKVITIPYAPGSLDNKWDFKPSVETNYTGVDIILDGAIEVGDLIGMTYESESLSVDSDYENNTVFTSRVSFKYDDDSLAPVDSKITYKFHLINKIDKAFELATEISSVKNKLGCDYVVGNTNTIPLKYLFKGIDGKNLDNQIIVLEVDTGGSKPHIRKTDITSANFATYPLDLSGIEFDGLPAGEDGNYRLNIRICIGEKESNADGEETGEILNSGAYTDLTVIFVNAQNITAETGKSIVGSNNTNIVLLSDIDFTESNTTTRKFNNVYGNLHTIKASGFNTSSSSTYMSEVIELYGTMDNTIITGPVYPKIVVDAGGGKYCWDGVCLSSSNAKITNSYISGFRAPVSVNSDAHAVSIKNSVIEGGTYANMFIHRSKTVTLENVYTIQARSGYAVTGDANKKILGLGIFCDTPNSGTIIFKGNTTQYNWVCKEDMNNYDAAAFYEVNLGFLGKYSIGIKQVIEYMVDNSSGYSHKVDGITFVNTGVLQENDNSATTQFNANAANGYTGVSYSTMKTVDAKILGIKIKSYNAYSCVTCDSCSHQWLPNGHTDTYGVSAYLADRAPGQNNTAAKIPYVAN